jgi:hypothetical protein
MKPIALILSASIMLAGCQSLGKLVTPNGQLITQTAVYVAVGAAVGSDPTTEKVKAGQIKSIATQVLALDQGQSVAIAAIEAAVTAKLATMNLPPPDMLAAQLLMATLATLVQNQLNAGAASPTAQVAIAQVLNDVITATAAYGV